MKSLFCFSLLAVFGLQEGLAQPVVQGTVLDSKGQAQGLVTVSLLKAADSSWLRSEVTGNNGHYSIHASAGSYFVVANAGGYESQTKRCTVDSSRGVTVDFRLATSSTSLTGVTISAKAPYIEARPGMMVVNVENSAASAGSNALELLQRSPGVLVDPQGAISMKGRNGVQVYIDGRPSRLSGDQLTAYLRSMTAEEISQLELITQPSSKYEAAGTAGIINIRTRAVRKQGLNGSFSATGTKATDYFGNLSGRLTYRRNKLTLYASEYYNYVSNHNTLEVDRRYFRPGTDEVNTIVSTRQDLHWLSAFHRMKIGGEYAISNSTSIGLRAQVPIGHPRVMYDNYTTIRDLDSGGRTYNSGSRDMENRWHEKEAGILGRHRFHDGGELSLDAFMVTNQGGDRGLFSNIGTDSAWNPKTTPDLWHISFPVNMRLISAQADYTRPLDKKTKLESGIKYLNIDVDYRANYKIPDGSGVFVPDTLRTTGLLYNETVAAAYTSVSRTISSKLEAQAGLRAEQTVGKGDETKTGQHFDRNYLSLFPTLFASYKPDSVHTITFSYGRRLDRPSYHALNPARNYIDKYSYSVGNPQLLPQFLHNIELGHSYKGALTSTLSFMRATGIISDFFVQDDSTKTAYEIHDNIDGYWQTGISMNYHKQLTPWWTMNFYADFYYKEYSGVYYGVDFTQKGNTHSFNTNNQLNLGHKWSAEVVAWYNGGGLTTVFTRPGPMGSLDVGVTKKLLSDSLVIKLAVNDVLETQRYSASNRFANFDTDVSSTWDTQRAVLSLNYNFGKSIDLMQRKGENGG